MDDVSSIVRAAGTFLLGLALARASAATSGVVLPALFLIASGASMAAAIDYGWGAWRRHRSSSWLRRTG